MRKVDCRYMPDRVCPWEGKASVKAVAEGIVWIDAPGHGGFQVSQDRYAAMPQKYRELSFTGDQYFEEDCSWCAVVLSFPEAFSEGTRQAAQRTYERVYGGDQ
jgi:hypothetical protein